MKSDSIVGLDESKLHEVIPKCTLNFDDWTSLILEIEKKYPDVIEKICLVYDSFLSEFPLCYGYWRKYAAHISRLCTVDKVVDVFERSVQLATYSVSIWVDYCSFSVSAFEDPSDVRRLFRRAISFVGKDYLSYSLWDKYIEFELSQQQWDSLALIYVQALRFPTKKLHYYYSSFKKLTASLKENFLSENGINSSMPMESEALPDGGIPNCYTDTEISSVIKDLLNLSIGTRYSVLQKYIRGGEKLYDEACQLEEKIIHFEHKIGRTYFHVKQLDESQLKNWHCYLDFVEMHGDFDWAVKLYERCLIVCANYPEFWTRYAEFMEMKGGREIAKFALERATENFLKRVRVIHVFNARFKEQIGDLSGARAAFLQLDVDLDSNFAENIILKANMEKRLGNFTAASNVYKEALEMALVKKKLHVLPSLYIHFSRLKYMITESVDAAMGILIEGIRNVPHCKLLFEELIRFITMHGGPKLINLVDSIIADAISHKQDVSQGWSDEDREDISSSYLKVVDLCGTIHDVMKVWNRHIKLFPHSIRAISYEDPVSGTETLRMDEGEKHATVTTVPNLPTKDGGPNLSTQLPLEDNKQSLSDNQDIQNDQAANVNEGASNLLENCNIDMKESSTDQIHSVEVEISAQARVQQKSPKVSDHFGEDGGGVELAQTPIDNSKEDEYDHALGQSFENLSMGNRSLSSKDLDKNDSRPKTSHVGEVPLETSMSNESVCNTSEGALMHNPIGGRSSDSIQIPIVVASPSSSASLDKPIHYEAPSLSRTPASRKGKWHHKRNAGNLHRDSQHQFHGHPQRRPHRNWRDSPRQYQGAKLGSQMPDSQDYTSESTASQKPPIEQSSLEHNQIQSAPSHDNVTTPLAWAAQQQNFPTNSQSQVPPQGFTQEQSQYISTNDEQYGHMKSGQAPQTYDQTWQYYYYQQQQQQYLLQQLQQSQFLQQQYPQQQQQVQQHYFQSQQQYPYQHLQLQHQYYSQQQPIQQHQHLIGLQPQQISQTDQQSIQQHEHQPEELEEEEPKQHEKQIALLPIQMWTGNHDQQDSWQNSGNSQSGAEPEQPNEASVKG